VYKTPFCCWIKVCAMTIGSGSRLFLATFFSSVICKVTRFGGENGQFQLNLIVHQMCNWE